jgi:hypothetical protein
MNIITTPAEGLARVAPSFTVAAAKTITGATNANPSVVTATAHGYSTGDHILIEAVGGATGINEKIFTITRVDANSFSVVNAAPGVYTSGGTAKKITTVGLSRDLSRNDLEVLLAGLNRMAHDPAETLLSAFTQ